MASINKILGQVVPTVNANSNLFTVASLHQYIVSNLIIANTSTTDSAFSIWARVGGATAANSNKIASALPIPANSTVQFALNMTFNATDILTATATIGTGTPLTFTAFGSDNN